MILRRSASGGPIANTRAGSARLKPRTTSPVWPRGRQGRTSFSSSSSSHLRHVDWKTSILARYPRRERNASQSSHVRPKARTSASPMRPAISRSVSRSDRIELRFHDGSLGPVHQLLDRHVVLQVFTQLLRKNLLSNHHGLPSDLLMTEIVRVFLMDLLEGTSVIVDLLAEPDRARHIAIESRAREQRCLQHRDSDRSGRNGNGAVPHSSDRADRRHLGDLNGLRRGLRCLVERGD